LLLKRERTEKTNNFYIERGWGYLVAGATKKRNEATKTLYAERICEQVGKLTRCGREKKIYLQACRERKI